MCGTCGCADEGDSRTIVLQQKVLAKNDELAERNRSFLAGRGAVMLNLMSSPGAGKTTLLESMAGVFSELPEVGVIEGDQETALDADRIKAAGYAVVQINTGAGCHLDADMVAKALDELDPQPDSIVLVENVGNLVCPALFDLGESARIVLASVTEGGDKPLKYPHMFRQADLVLVTKIDLMPHVDFDLEQYATDVRRLNPRTELLTVSARTGDGLAEWCEWLSARARPLSRPDQG